MKTDPAEIPPQHYEKYEEFFRDGQIEPHEFPKYIEENPGFAAWIKNRALLHF